MSPTSLAPSVAVIDRDTIEAIYNNQPERICLSGVDCLEKGQDYGQKAKHAVSGIASGKDVTVQSHGHDKYKHNIADVILPDGTNGNHTLAQ